MYWDLLVKLEDKKKMYRELKPGHVIWKYYRVTTKLCRDGIRKAEAQLELDLIRSAKKDEKIFYKYINEKRSVQEGISSCRAIQASW